MRFYDFVAFFSNFWIFRIVLEANREERKSEKRKEGKEEKNLKENVLLSEKCNKKLEWESFFGELKSCVMECFLGRNWSSKVWGSVVSFSGAKKKYIMGIINVLRVIPASWKLLFVLFLNIRQQGLIHEDQKQ